MSFYDDASLVFLAGAAAGKDGKAYSLKPTDGSGDFTLTRGTNLTATRVGKDGYIEKGRENLFLQSNQFDTTWVLGGSPTLTSGHTGYDGSQDAWKLVTSSGENIYQSVSPSGVNTFSFYVRGDGSTGVRMYLDGPGGASDVFFNLATGSVQQTSPAAIDETIEAITGSPGDTDRWYRISLTFYDDDTASGDNQNVTRARLYTTANGTANAGGTLFIQDAQLEQGLVATDYIETGASTATAGLLEDEPRFDYTGGGCPALLMEPTRTNHINHSEYGGGYETVDSNLTVTDNTEVSPEGYSNAVKIEDISTSSATQAVKFGALESGSVVGRTFTGSLYIKPVNSGDVGGNVYLSLQRRSGDFEGLTETIEIDSADWKRYEITYTFTGAGAGNQTGCDFKILKTGTPIDDIYVYGVQLEEGAFATSYIPTYGSSATRAKEGFTDSYDQIDQLDLSSSGLNGEDVSWFFELKNNQDVARDSGATTIRVNNSADNDGSFRIYRASSGVKQLTVVFRDTNGNSTPSSYEMTSENPKVLVKRTWSTGRIQAYVDGALVRDQIDLDYNAWYKLELGGAGSTLELKQALAFPTVLSNNDSEILTGATSYRSFNVMRSARNYTAYE
jgi:hypothetical protein